MTYIGPFVAESQNNVLISISFYVMNKDAYFDHLIRWRIGQDELFALNETHFSRNRDRWHQCHFRLRPRFRVRFTDQRQPRICHMWCIHSEYALHTSRPIWRLCIFIYEVIVRHQRSKISSNDVHALRDAYESTVRIYIWLSNRNGQKEYKL